MKFETEQYSIEIFSDPAYKVGSTDNNNQYDFIYFNESKYLFTSVFGIKVFENDLLVKCAVIASSEGATGVHATSTIIEKDRILHCCSDTIFCLSIPDLALVWRTKADMITCFQIFKYRDKYIVHGEMEISMIDKQGKILWQQGGADIFVAPDGREGFRVTDNFILATDFCYREYKFDFDGRSIL